MEDKLVFKGLGVDSLTGRYVFTKLCAADTGLENETLKTVALEYPHLKNLEIQNNDLTTLDSLRRLRGLVVLDASGNKISTVLDYKTPCCRLDKDSEVVTINAEEKKQEVFDGPFENGEMWTGSLLQLANLSRNRIQVVDDLSWHSHLHTLDLSHNFIIKLGEGFKNLPSLRSLNLASNKLESLEGIENLRLEKLVIDDNRVQSLRTLADQFELKCFSARNNLIEQLDGVETCAGLTEVDLIGNHICRIIEVNKLDKAKSLKTLSLKKNPLQELEHYRFRVLYRLQYLKMLDEKEVLPTEMVDVVNFYGKDLENRKKVFERHLPGKNFICHIEPYCDREESISKLADSFAAGVIDQSVKSIEQNNKQAISYFNSLIR